MIIPVRLSGWIKEVYEYHHICVNRGLIVNITETDEMRDYADYALSDKFDG